MFPKTVKQAWALIVASSNIHKQEVEILVAAKEAAQKENRNKS